MDCRSKLTDLQIGFFCLLFRSIVSQRKDEEKKHLRYIKRCHMV